MSKFAKKTLRVLLIEHLAGRLSRPPRPSEHLRLLGTLTLH